MGSSISGRNIPLFPTSTQRLSIGWKAKISREGYGMLISQKVIGEDNR
jgi:hypothetical protein